MKKLFAILLATALLVSCFCGSASAYDASVPSIEVQEVFGTSPAIAIYDHGCTGSVSTADDGDVQISVVEEFGCDKSNVATYDLITNDARTTSIPKTYHNLAASSYTGSFNGVGGTMYTGNYFSTSANADLYYKVTLYSDYSTKCQAKIRLYDITDRKWITNADYLTAEFGSDVLTVRLHAYNLNVNHHYCVAVSWVSGYSFSGSFLVTHNSNYT